MHKEKQKTGSEEPPRATGHTSVYPMALLDKGDIARTFAIAIVFISVVLGSFYGLYHLIN